MAKRAKTTKRIIFGLLLVAVSLGLAWYLYPQALSAEGVNQHVRNLKARIDQRLQGVGLGQGDAESNPAEVAYKFAVLSDSHEDTTYFPAIVDQIAAREDLAFVATLGDLSNAGEPEKLQQAKDMLDRIAVPVYVLPGDHDLNWFPNHDLTNFKRIFNQNRTSYSFNFGQQHFIMLDNSDPNRGIDQSTWEWLQSDLQAHRQRGVFVMMSTPLSNPYLGFKVMGSQNESVKAQAEELRQLLKPYQVKAIFAGDTHTFSQYTDEGSDIPVVTVGAAGSNKNPLPMYVIVEILSDGSYNVSSVPVSSGTPERGN